MFNLIRTHLHVSVFFMDDVCFFLQCCLEIPVALELKSGDTGFGQQHWSLTLIVEVIHLAYASRVMCSHTYFAPHEC